MLTITQGEINVIIFGASFLIYTIQNNFVLLMFKFSSPIPKNISFCVHCFLVHCVPEECILVKQRQAWAYNTYDIHCIYIILSSRATFQYSCLNIHILIQPSLQASRLKIALYLCCVPLRILLNAIVVVLVFCNIPVSQNLLHNTIHTHRVDLDLDDVLNFKTDLLHLTEHDIWNFLIHFTIYGVVQTV